MFFLYMKYIEAINTTTGKWQPKYDIRGLTNHMWPTVRSYLKSFCKCHENVKYLENDAA